MVTALHQNSPQACQSKSKSSHLFLPKIAGRLLTGKSRVWCFSFALSNAAAFRSNQQLYKATRIFFNRFLNKKLAIKIPPHLLFNASFLFRSMVVASSAGFSCLVCPLSSSLPAPSTKQLQVVRKN